MVLPTAFFFLEDRCTAESTCLPPAVALTMTRLQVAVLLCLLGSACVSGSARRRRAPTLEELGLSGEENDNDIGMDEEDLQQVFDTFDLNENGVVTRSEFKKAMCSRASKLCKFATAIFAGLDTSGNGFLTKNDIETIIDNIDMDNDRSLRQEEYANYFAMHVEL